MTTMLVENVRTLDGFEPCDKCGNRSYFVAVKDSLELTFCAHHGMEATDALETQGFIVSDQTHLLSEQL